MIETQEAVDNINDILDVDGLDGAFVGKQCARCYVCLYPINFKTSEPVSSHITLQRSMVDHFLIEFGKTRIIREICH